MVIARTRLPHLLPPRAYHDEEHHRREVRALFHRGFHAVATRDELPAPGSFVTRDLAGTPIIVRRDTQGEGLHAFVNVCAHRHALLTHAPCGRGRRLRCQYHGWEYDDAGEVAKIPDAACFVPVRRGSERLQELRVATLGRLIFVSLTAEGPDLETTLGPRLSALIARLFGDDRRASVSFDLDHPCNWKVPLENVLESYHVPLLHQSVVARHPRLLRLFRGPVRGAEEHELEPGFSVVHDELGGASRLYRAAVHALRPGASLAFDHVHVYPSMIVGETALVGFVQVTLPVTATTSRSFVRFSLDLGQAGRPLLERALARLADRAAGTLFTLLQREDAPIFPQVQRGMMSSGQAGVLGSREERIHGFHAYLEGALAAADAEDRVRDGQ